MLGLFGRYVSLVLFCSHYEVTVLVATTQETVSRTKRSKNADGVLCGSDANRYIVVFLSSVISESLFRIVCDMTFF